MAREHSPSGSHTRRSSASGDHERPTGAGGQAAAGQATEVLRPRRPLPMVELQRNYGSMQSVPGRSTTASPQTQSLRTPKKPALGKRSASSFRAQEFSVDDSHAEVELDNKLAKTVSGNTLRRAHSTLRRRPTAQAPTLARLESNDREEAVLHHTNSGPEPVRDPAATRTESDDTDETLRVEEEEEPPAIDDDNDDDADGDDDDEGEEDDEADLSDAESFTLKDRQEAINETHPFGIRIWKPALYKKDRSVQTTAEGDIHSTPGGNVGRWLVFFNILWTLIFGWWLALVAFLGGLICLAFRFNDSCNDYGIVLCSLAGYLLYPFGMYLKLEHDEDYADEDHGEGRSIGEYERWQTGELEEGRLFFGPADINRSLIGRRRESMGSMNETDSLLSRTGRSRRRSTAHTINTKKRPFGRGKWNLGRIIFFVIFYGLLTPLLLLVSGICWFLVFTIPMGKVTLLLLYHLRRHPLALNFHSDNEYSRNPTGPSSSILLCTYRAVGIKYWKYTIDGTNIFLINLLGMVAFAIFDFYVLRGVLKIDSPITSSGFVFVLSLFSIIPLAYFIGQAVASISAQSSMGVGATINAFFSTIVEVFLYCVALNEGKAQLVEGSIIGSIFAGILLLPGISMCFGAIKRKTQRFNVRSAGVSSTMLMFAIIGSFGPTLFYQIYGSHELNCHQCVDADPLSPDRDCRRCFYNQVPAVHDRFFVEAVRPYIWFAATLLFLAYVIGLLFTLRTHAAMIWNSELDEKKVEKMEHAAGQLEHRNGHAHTHSTAHSMDPHASLRRQDTAGTIGTLSRENIRESQLYKRILGQSLRQAGITSPSERSPNKRDASNSTAVPNTPHLVPPKTTDDDFDKRSQRSLRLTSLSPEDNHTLVRQVAEMAATAAAVATRDATRAPRKAAHMASTSSTRHHSTASATERPDMHRSGTLSGDQPAAAEAAGLSGTAVEPASGGHDAPNWSRTKSAVILMTATVAYAVIAEILVDTVDSVLENVDIDEKFLGITLFALVPNTTEFLNAISFAMNGNIALSMEIGSAYALQVMLLQVPALVAYSAIYSQWLDPLDVVDHTFTLIFPQWDMVTVILGLFLMSYVVGEGKSNYFKGSMLVLGYLVVVVGFWFSGYNSLDNMGIGRFDTMATGSRTETFKTIGRASSGRAF